MAVRLKARIQQEAVSAIGKLIRELLLQCSFTSYGLYGSLSYTFLGVEIFPRKFNAYMRRICTDEIF